MISKKITAILKLGLALLPAATALGGLGTIIGMSVKESSENDMAVDLYAQTEDFIAEKEGKLQLAKQAFDNGEISEEEFENLTDHLNSKEFIQSALKSNVIRDEEVKTHIAKRDASSRVNYTALSRSV